MNRIFSLTINKTEPVSSDLIFRRLEPIAASGATILFNSTLSEHKPVSTPSPLLSALVQFFHTLILKEIPDTSCPEVTPWAQPRLLNVPSLPHPPFSTQALPKPLLPHLNESTESIPLILDIQENAPEILQDGLKIGIEGVLRQDPFGMVYLEIDPKLIDSLLPSPALQRLPSKIPVIFPQETQDKLGWGGVQELGETFPLTVTGLYSEEPSLRPDIERVWYCTLHAPTLASLREHYMHPGRRHFFLTLGTKKQTSPKKPSPPLYRLNVSCFAA